MNVIPPREMVLFAITIFYTFAIGNGEANAQITAEEVDLEYSRAWETPNDQASIAFVAWIHEFINSKNAEASHELIERGVLLATHRKQVMLDLMVNSPSRFFDYTLPTAIRTELPTAVSTHVEEILDGVGFIETYCDTQDSTINIKNFSHLLVANEYARPKRLEGHFHGILLDRKFLLHPTFLAGQPIDFGSDKNHSPGLPLEKASSQGRAKAPSPAETEVEEQPTLSDPIGQESKNKLLIVRATFLDATEHPVSIEQIEETMASLNKLLIRESQGEFFFDYEIADNTYLIDANIQETLWYDVQTLTREAIGDDFNTKDYDFFTVITPSGPWPFAGRATQDYGSTHPDFERNSHFNGGFDLGITTHEYGHNFGFGHANMWVSRDDNPTSEDAYIYEYGNWFNIMGFGRTGSGYGTFYNHYKGWLPENSITIANGSSTERIYSATERFLDSTSDNYAISVDIDGFFKYWIEAWRVKTYSTEDRLLNSGVLVHKVNNFRSSYTKYSGAMFLVEYGTPGTNPIDAPLQMDGTIVDEPFGIAIRPVRSGSVDNKPYVDIEVVNNGPKRSFLAFLGPVPSVDSDRNKITFWGPVEIKSKYESNLTLHDDGSVHLYQGGQREFSADLTEHIEKVKELAPGEYVNGVVHQDGSVTMFQSNNPYHDLTDKDIALLEVPDDLAPVSRLSVGRHLAIAALEDGTIRSWGTEFFQNAPQPDGLNDIVDVASTYRTLFALRESGKLVMWGDTIGFNEIPENERYVKIEEGEGIVLALTEDGRVHAFGNAAYNNYNPYQVPVGLPPASELKVGTEIAGITSIDGQHLIWNWKEEGFRDLSEYAEYTNLEFDDYDLNRYGIVGLRHESQSPRVVGHPESSQANEDGSVSFQALFEDQELLNFRWQKRAGADDDWEDVTSESPYSGQNTDKLTITTIDSEILDSRFRCIARYSDSNFESVTLSARVLPAKSLDLTQVELPHTEVVYEIGVNATGDWSIENLPPWASSPKSSGNGSDVLQITVTQNDSFDSRSSTIQIAGIDHTLTQFGIPQTEVGEIEGNVETLGSDLSISIDSNTTWIVAGLPSWIHSTPAWGTGDGTVILTIEENSTGRFRNSTLLLDSKQIDIFQGAVPVIERSPVGGTYFEKKPIDLEISAIVDGDFQYKWEYRKGNDDAWKPLSEQNSPKLTLAKGTGTFDELFIRCVVSNEYGSSESDSINVNTLHLPILELESLAGKNIKLHCYTEGSIQYSLSYSTDFINWEEMEQLPQSSSFTVPIVINSELDELPIFYRIRAANYPEESFGAENELGM